LGIGNQPILELNLTGIDKRKHVQLKDKNNAAFKAPLYTVIAYKPALILKESY